jgi:hypothetical protein
MSNKVKEISSEIESQLKQFAIGLGNQLLKLLADVPQFNNDRGLFSDFLKSELRLSLPDAELAIAIAREAQVGKYELLANSTLVIFDMMQKMVEKEIPDKASEFGAVKKAFLNS